MPAFKGGEAVPLLGNMESVKILNFIAGGGQGEVYRVIYREKEYALKWYTNFTPTANFYDNLLNNVKRDSPSRHFLWPIAVTEHIGKRFGYIMDLVPENYHAYGDFLLNIARFKSWNVLIKAALNIVDSYCILHSMGYCYRDLNEGSFFINPDNGDVLICDNDNISPVNLDLGIKGFPRYMAPEIVTDKSMPNAHTDRYSLSVILFRLFYIDHPLEGRYTAQFPLDDVNGAKMFGENPVFIYDPHNESNRPTPEMNPNVIQRWNMFPPDLKYAFIKSFTSGLKDINSRLTDAAWREVLVKTRGMLIKVNGKEQFVNCYKPATIKHECRILQVKDHLIALTPSSVIYQCQIDQSSVDYISVAGVVKPSRSDPHVWGLANLTNSNWKATLPRKKPVDIIPKKFAPLIKGITIDFGSVTGKVY